MAGLRRRGGGSGPGGHHSLYKETPVKRAIYVLDRSYTLAEICSKYVAEAVRLSQSVMASGEERRALARHLAACVRQMWKTPSPRRSPTAVGKSLQRLPRATASEIVPGRDRALPFLTAPRTRVGVTSGGTGGEWAGPVSVCHP